MPRRSPSKVKRTKETHDAWKTVTALLARRNKLIKVDFQKRRSATDSTIDDNALVSASKTAMQLGVSPKTLANWRTQGTYGPEFTKIGSRVFYRQSAINAFIINQSAHSSSEFAP